MNPVKGVLFFGKMFLQSEPVCNILFVAGKTQTESRKII